MFRMAALFVVERLKPWLLTYLAALLAGCPDPNLDSTPPPQRPERRGGAGAGADTDDETAFSPSAAVGPGDSQDLDAGGFGAAAEAEAQEALRVRVWAAYSALVQVRSQRVGGHFASREKDAFTLTRGWQGEKEAVSGVPGCGAAGGGTCQGGTGSVRKTWLYEPERKPIYCLLVLVLGERCAPLPGQL